MQNVWVNGGGDRIEEPTVEEFQWIIHFFENGGPTSVLEDTNVCGLDNSDIEESELGQNVYGNSEFSAVSVFPHGSGLVITLAFDWSSSPYESWKNILALSLQIESTFINNINK